MEAGMANEFSTTAEFAARFATEAACRDYVHAFRQCGAGFTVFYSA